MCRLFVSLNQSDVNLTDRLASDATHRRGISVPRPVRRVYVSNRNLNVLALWRRRRFDEKVKISVEYSFNNFDVGPVRIKKKKKRL